MNDTIYRQDAIDAIKKSRFLVDAMEKVIKLPSAQPKKKLLFSDRLQIIELYKEWILRNGAKDCAESFLAYLIIEGYIDG